MPKRIKSKTGSNLGALDAKSAGDLDSLRTKVIWGLVVVIGLLVYLFSK